MAVIRLTIDDRELVRSLKRLGGAEQAKVVAGALNRTSFEILEAEGKHVSSIFRFASGATKKFLADKGFVFDKATPGRLRSVIKPKPKAEGILGDHASGDPFTAEEGGRLGFGGKLAVPIAAKRGARGTVPAKLLPSRVVKSGGGGFVNEAGTVILQRFRDRSLQVLYALVPQARVSPAFEFFETARRTAVSVFPSKIRREIEKLAEGKKAT